MTRIFLLFTLSNNTVRNEDLIIPESMAQDFGCTVVLETQAHSWLRNYLCNAEDKKKTSKMLNQLCLDTYWIACTHRVPYTNNSKTNFAIFAEPPPAPILCFTCCKSFRIACAYCLSCKISIIS